MSSSGFFLHSWALGIFGVALILFFVEILYRRAFQWCIVTRFVWLVLLAALIGHWQMVRGRVLSDPQELNIVMDRSDSLLEIPERAARIEELKTEILSWAKTNHQAVNFYSFAENFVEGEGSGSGYHSFLSKADPLLSRDVNVILASDGLFSGPTKVRAQVLAIQMGNSAEKDLWIEQAPTQVTAFLKNRGKISVVLGQQGFRGETVTVKLKHGSEVLDEKTIRLTGDEEALEMNFFPDRMGESIFLIEVEAQNGELSRLNNLYPVRVRTVRDKIRLLHVSGKPSLDLRAWRNFLTRQPDVDLVSFYILRSLSDDPRAKNTELSLIPFPYEDLFSVELEKFDVVILQNFDFNLYFPPFYLDNLARFVREGGALLMMGGDQGFQKYALSPLASLMPFEFMGAGEFQLAERRVTKFQAHPIVQGLEAALQRIPFSGAHQIRPRSDGIAMASFADGVPWLSVIEQGRGRVVSLNSDESWRLQLSPDVDGLTFGRLARRILQFLTFDPEVDPQTVLSSSWRVGQPVKLSLTKQQPADWTIRNLLRDGEIKKFELTETVEFTVPEAGIFEVKNSLSDRAYFYETDKQPWRSEWKRLISSDEKMKALAKKLVSYEERRSIFETNLMGREVISEEVQPWSNESRALSFLILSLLLVALFLDFYLRKKARWDF